MQELVTSFRLYSGAIRYAVHNAPCWFLGKCIETSTFSCIMSCQLFSGTGEKLRTGESCVKNITDIMALDAVRGKASLWTKSTDGIAHSI